MKRKWKLRPEFEEDVCLNIDTLIVKVIGDAQTTVNLSSFFILVATVLLVFKL